MYQTSPDPESFDSEARVTGSRQTSFSLSITRDPPQAIRFLRREIQLYHPSSATSFFFPSRPLGFLSTYIAFDGKSVEEQGQPPCCSKGDAQGGGEFYAVFACEVCGNDDGEIGCFVVEVVDALWIGRQSIVLPKCKGDLSAWPNCVPMRVRQMCVVLGVVVVGVEYLPSPM
jgi:hypothetical protein